MPASSNYISFIILVTTYGMGNADSSLKIQLLQKYLGLLNENDVLPKAICFYTDGVKLVVRGSPVLDQLESLEKKGVSLIICKTCLDYFGLYEGVRVGIVGGMTDIIHAQMVADKVITI